MKSVVRVGAKGKGGGKMPVVEGTGDRPLIDARAELIQALIPIGLEAVNELLQQEVVSLVGARYSRGGGSKQYPPKMMLQLLIYCYASGIFSSRRIERATYRDVAVRLLTADTHPDHDTICTFQHENFEAVSEAFLQVLQLARSLRILSARSRPSHR